MKKSQVVLIQKKSLVADIIHSNINLLPNCNIIYKNSISEALNIVSLLEKVDFFIIEGSLINNENLLETEKMIEISKAQLIIGQGAPKEFENSILMKNFSDWEAIVKKAIMLITTGNHNDYKQGYSPFTTSIFGILNNAPCDIFLKVKKSQSDDQYVKRVHKEDSIEKDFVKYYQDKNVDFFYIKESDVEKLMEALTDQINFLLESSKSHSDNDYETNIKTSVEHTVEIIRSIGLQNTSTELITNVIDNLYNMVDKSNSKSALRITGILNKKDQSYFDHVFLTSLVSSNILDKLDWGATDHKKQITQAALFCDIYLEKSSWSTILSQQEIEKQNLNQTQTENILFHAHNAASEVASFDKILPEVEKLILRHHGHPSGTDLCDDWYGGLTGLSLVFNTSYQLSAIFIKENIPGVEINYLELIENYIEKNKHQKSISKIFDALRQSFISSLQNM